MNERKPSTTSHRPGLWMALVLALTVGAVVLWQQSDRAPAPDDPASQPQSSVLDHDADDARSEPMDPRDAGQGGPDRSSEANGSMSGVPASAPLSERVQSLVQRLGDYRDAASHRALGELVALGDSAADEVSAALRNVSRAEQAARQAGTPDQRLATSRLQLIVALGEIGGPQHARLLREVAAESGPDSMAHQNVAIALARMGAQNEARQFAREALTKDGMSDVEKRALLSQLAHRAQLQDREVARRYMSAKDPDYTRDIALLIAARTGMADEVKAALPDIVDDVTHSQRDVYALIALAETLPPEEFAARVEGTPLAGSRPKAGHYRLAREHGEFMWADDAGKEALLARQLQADHDEPVIAGLRFMLENNRVDLLDRHGILLHPQASGAPMTVRPRYQKLLGFTGYRIETRSGTAIISPVDPG